MLGKCATERDVEKSDSVDRKGSSSSNSNSYRRIRNMKKRKKEIKEKKVEKENLQSNKEFKYDINCRCCRPLLSHSLFYPL